MKNILKLLLLTTLVIFFGCAKDEFEEPIRQNENKISYVSIEQVPFLIPSIQKYNKAYSYLSKSSSSSHKESLDLNLDLEKILEYTYANGEKSYSIRIKETFSIYDDKYFENLHLYKKDNVYEPIIFKYNAIDDSKEFKMSEFEGTVELFDINREPIGIAIYEKNIPPCYKMTYNHCVELDFYPNGDIIITILCADGGGGGIIDGGIGDSGSSSGYNIGDDSNPIFLGPGNYSNGIVHNAIASGIAIEIMPNAPTMFEQFMQNLEPTQSSFLNSLDVNIKNSIEEYLNQNNFSQQSQQFVKNWIDIVISLESNPNLLLEIPCDQIPAWQNLAQYEIPQSCLDKIEDLMSQNSSATPNWDIQYLSGAQGAVVNMDFFPVTITQFPINPSTNQPYTPQQFYTFFRQNINTFSASAGVTFAPSTITGYNETTLWNSNNPVGAIISINMQPDSGSVMCTNFSQTHWYFTTLTSPWAASFTQDDYDGLHPVSGNREFGYYVDVNGNYVYFVRGVDRIQRNSIELIANMLNPSNPFSDADSLWNTMQQNLKDYVQNNGGAAIINTDQIYRPDWNKVKEVLQGTRPKSDLGCN